MLPLEEVPAPRELDFDPEIDNINQLFRLLTGGGVLLDSMEIVSLYILSAQIFSSF